MIRDPITVIVTDIWAATEILIPAFIYNGHILDAGFTATNNLGQTGAFSWDGAKPLAVFNDGFVSGDTEHWSTTTPQ